MSKCKGCGRELNKDWGDDYCFICWLYGVKYLDLTLEDVEND